MTGSNVVIASRLQERMDAAGESQSSLARAVGVSQQTIGKLLADKPSGSTHLHRIARALHTTAEYLTGEATDPSEGALPTPTPALLAEQLDIVRIPVLDLRFGMGGGTFAESVEPVERMSVSRDLIRMWTSAPLDGLVYATGTGDSMYPTIHDRDGLLIDMSQRELRMGDQIWALYHYGLGMVKRIRPTAGGYVISSDNPHVADITAADNEMSIVGRVVGVFRRV
ncbi:XRE family transcriptional regulator [Asticcacaulis solisilvae]|uniref:XRE family transcriptional regulator n=1 Tax=Asticcacaulis solisilvae TaxID=1217274 RepID=UPI003FD8C40E